MKKSILVILIIVVLGGIFFFFVSKKQDPAVQNDNTKTSPSIFTITPLSSDVSLKESGDFTIIESPATTSEKSSVKTSSNGRALIESEFGHPIAVNFSSTVVIAKSGGAENKTSIELTGGEIWARTQKLVEKGEYLEIKTGNAVAVVRGTSFGLAYDGITTTLLVDSGEVSLFNSDKDFEVIVKAGGRATITRNERPKTSQISASDKNSNWYKFNTKTDYPPDQNSRPTVNISPLGISNTPTATTSSTIPTSSNTSTGSGGSTGGSANTTTKPIVRSVSPKTISAGDSRTLVMITGAGFKNVTEVVIGELLMPGFSVMSDGSLQFHIDPQLPPGTYDINLSLSDDTFFTIPNGITVIADVSVSNTFLQAN